MRRTMLALLIGVALVVPALPAHAASVKVVKKTVEVGAAKPGSVKVACPKGTKVTGGGVSSPSFPYVRGSYPFDGKDRGTTPEDGWKAEVSNGSSSQIKVTVFAMCAMGTFTYLSSDPVAVPDPGRNDGGDVLCDEGSVTGGGVRVAPTEPLAGSLLAISTSAPINDPTDGAGWTGGASNSAGGDAEMTVFAICSSGGSYSYISSVHPEGTIVGATGIRADCPSGMRATGGGVETGTAANVYVEKTSPTMASDSDILGTAWETYAAFSPPGTSLAAHVICVAA